MSSVIDIGADGFGRIMWLAGIFPRGARDPYGAFNVTRAVSLRQAGFAVQVIAPLSVSPPIPGTSNGSAREFSRWFASRRQALRSSQVAGLDVRRPVWVHPPRSRLWRLAGQALYLQMLPQIRSVTRRYQPDVIVASRLFPEGACAGLVGRRLRIPSFAIAEGSEVVFDYAKYAGSTYPRTLISDHLDGVVYVSNALREEAHALGIVNDCETVIPNPVDAAFSSAKHHSDSRCKRIVVVGSMQPVKGHDLLIDALMTMGPSGLKGVEVLLVGDGPLRGGLEERVLSAGLSKSVRFLGRRPNAEVAAIMGTATIACVPSRFEGMCVAAAEALSAGVPVVSFNVGGLPEVVTDGRNGLLAAAGNPSDLATKLREALDRRWDRSGILAEAWRRYSPDAYANALLEFCRDSARRR